MNSSRFFANTLQLICFACLSIAASLFFAVQCRADETDNLIKSLDDYSLDARNAVVERLGQIRNERSISTLITMLYDTDEDWLLRKKIILLFREIKDPRTVDPVMNSLYDRCPTVRWNAAIALSELPKSSMVIDALIYTLDDRVLFMREAAIQSLGKLKAVQALHFVIAALEDKSFTIRHAAIKALQLIGPANAVKRLRRIAEDDPDALIRAEALKTLNALTKEETSSYQGTTQANSTRSLTRRSDSAQPRHGSVIDLP